jgi:S-adenosylmethionine-diacylglycerol 3-amino-3-carboxypropyl transferase
MNRPGRDRIRFANCWEDTEVALAALAIRPGRRYVSIASAGDVTLAMLSRNPAEVLAVDRNQAQLSGLELRAAALERLSHRRLLQFLGVTAAEDRGRIYRDLADRLSAPARRFWDDNQRGIARGIIHAGRVEKYFYWFRKVGRPWLVPNRTRDRLAKPGDPVRKSAYIGCLLHSRRWSFFLWLLFSRRLFGSLGVGRDRQTAGIPDRDIIETVRRRIAAALAAAGDKNYFLDYILTGNFGETLPLYLRPENHLAIRSKLSALHLYRGRLTEALSGAGRAHYDGFYLSDIFEYMTEREFEAFLDRILAAANPGARVVYWNNLLDRTPRPRPGLIPRAALAASLFARNRAFFYGSLTILEKT